MMKKSDLELRIKELELELSNLKSCKATKQATSLPTKHTSEESDVKFLGITNYVPAYIAYVNADTLRYEFVNDLYEKSFGIPRERIIGSHLKDFLGEKNYEFALKYIKEVKSGKSVSYENSFDMVSGKRWVQVNYTPVFDDNSKVVGIALVNYDITERKHTEKLLQESEKHLEDAQELSKIGSWTWEVANDTVKWSKELYQINGRNPNFPAPSYAEMSSSYTKESWNLLSAAVVNALERKESYALELTIVRPDGTLVNTLARGEPTYDDNDKIVRLHGTVQDITELKQAEKALKENEKRLRFYTDNSPMAIVEWNFDFIVTKWTGESERIFGWKSEEVVGKKITDLNIIYEPDIPIVEKTTEKLTSGLFKQVISSNRNYRKDRSIINCEWYNTILKDEKGEMLSILSQVLDITERKKTEKKLLFINKAVESASDAIGISDAQGHHFYQNKALSEMFGYPTAEEIEGLGGGAVVVKDPEVAKEMYGNIMSGKSWSGELEMVKKSGRVFQAYERADAIKDSEGKIIGLIGIVTDITERKKAEGNLRESENKYRNLFNNSEVGMFRTRLGGSEILEFNEKYLKILGYTHDEIKGKPSKDIWANKQERDNMVQQLITEGQVTDLECDLLTKQGNVINCITSLRLFSNRILEGSIQDITNRKLAEEEIKNMKESLQQLNYRLEEIREDERSLIAGEIHDRLGQALTALKIDTYWLIKKTTIESEESKKLKGMAELLTGISTDVQRISAELRPPMLDDVGLVAALEWYIEEFEKRTSVKCHLKLDDIKFPDEKKGLALYRVLQEALTNVARHANAKKVNINLYQSDDSIVMEVIDDGIGIEKTRINSYKSLGLIGMRERVKKYNGTMDISSALKKGTKIRVSIPLN